MPIDRTHSQPTFSAQEMCELLQQQRVVVFDPEIGLKSGFRYAVFVDPLEQISGMVLVDAWEVNAIGQKNPEMLFPSPVNRGDLLDLDFAPREIRRPILDYSVGREQTFIFRLGGVDQKSDAFHVRALGVGVNEAAASLDASDRLVGRYPALRSAKLRASSDMQFQSALFDSLKTGSAVVHQVYAFSYPRADQMGHEYMSNETHSLASVLQSHGDVAALVASLTEASISDILDAIRPQARKLMRAMEIDHEMVDWSEVVSGFSSDVSVETQTSRLRLVENPKTREEAPEQDGASDARRIDPDVLDVLRRSIVDGFELRLPPEKLAPQLYRRVNEVLLALGGKWVGRKSQAHVFDEDVGPVMEVVLATGSFLRPKDFGFFPTPAHLVRQLLEVADIEPSMRVLEPSAGHGAIAFPLSEVAGGLENVTVCEFLPRNARRLRDLGFSRVVEGDFLAMEPEPIYDRVVMNPPFGGGADIAHVMHAARFLKPDGRLVAITSPAWTTHQNRKSEAFRSFVEDVCGEVSSIERGAFRESGTDIETRMVVMDAENFPWNKETDSRRERMRG